MLVLVRVREGFRGRDRVRVRVKIRVRVIVTNQIHVLSVVNDDNEGRILFFGGERTTS